MPTENETKPETPAEFVKVLQQLALSYEGFENWRCNTPPQAKSIARDKLARDAAGVIVTAFNAGHFQDLQNLADLIEFHFNSGPPMVGYPPNYARSPVNFVNNVKRYLMAECPDHFGGKTGDEGTMVAAVLRLLAGKIKAPVQKEAEVSKLEHEERGKRLLKKSRNITLCKFANTLGIPKTTAGRMNCWIDRPHHNRAGRKVRVGIIDPAKLETVGADIRETKEHTAAIDALIDEQAAEAQADGIKLGRRR